MKPYRDAIQAAIYARVSSDQQTEAGTIVSQVTVLTERCQRDGLTLDPEFCFLDDGYSGGTLMRPALERLRDTVANGAIDRLYVHSPDRLARKYAYQVLLVDEFQRAGVDLIFLNRQLGRSPEDDLLLQVQGMIAEYERAKIVERSRRGKRYAAQRGCVSVLSSAPYGYRYIRKSEGGGTARYEIMLPEARVVRQIFAWMAEERCSIGEICRRLQQQGVASPKERTIWDRTTVWGILNNPAYQGTARFGRSRLGPRRARLRPPRNAPEQPRQEQSIYASVDGGVPIAVPAIVDEALFAAVAEQLADNRQRMRQRWSGPRYLLQGLLVCKHCGYAYCGVPTGPATAKGSAKRYVYYRCGNRNGKQSICPRICWNKSIRADGLEEAVWNDVCALLKDPAQVAHEYERRLQGTSRRARARQDEALAKLLPKVQRGIARLIDAYAEGLLDKHEFEPRLQGARERLAQLEAEAQAQAEEQAAAAELRLVIGHLQEFAERVQSGLAQADWSMRRDIIRAVVKRIEVDAEEVRVVYRVSPSPFVEGPDRGLLQDCRKRGCRADGGRPPSPLPSLRLSILIEGRLLALLLEQYSCSAPSAKIMLCRPLISIFDAILPSRAFILPDDSGASLTDSRSAIGSEAVRWSF
jgi:site-specific DNA recombinase